ncbi:MAG: hypothetical protein RR538_09205 [Erysipelotrichaceae bacterium]
MRRNEIQRGKVLGVCPICNKPIRENRVICEECSTKFKRVKAYYKGCYNFNITIAHVVYLQGKNREEEDILDFVLNNPINVFRLRITKERLNKMLLDRKKSLFKAFSIPYKKYCEVPFYIIEFMSNFRNYKLLYIEGNKGNPLITYMDKESRKVKKDLYSYLKQNKSIGELQICRFLDELKIQYKTEYDTLPCISSKTDRILPYDFEITKAKLLIELHGIQHFQYIQNIHKCKERFVALKWRDNFKQNFAKEVGYQLLVLTYDDLYSNTFKYKIVKAIMEQIKKGEKICKI